MRHIIEFLKACFASPKERVRLVPLSEIVAPEAPLAGADKIPCAWCPGPGCTQDDCVMGYVLNKTWATGESMMVNVNDDGSITEQAG